MSSAYLPRKLGHETVHGEHPTSSMRMIDEMMLQGRVGVTVLLEISAKCTGVLGWAIGSDETLDQTPIAELEPSDGDECSLTLGWPMGRGGTLDQTPIGQLGLVDVETAILSDDGCWQPSRKYGAGPAPSGECGVILEQHRSEEPMTCGSSLVVQRRWQCVHCFRLMYDCRRLADWMLTPYPTPEKCPLLYPGEGPVPSGRLRTERRVEQNVDRVHRLQVATTADERGVIAGDK